MAYHPFIGGAEVAIKEITDRVSPRDIEFHMITLRYNSTFPSVEHVRNILVHRVGPGFKNTTIRDTHKSIFYPLKALFVPLAVLTALKLHRMHRYDGFWAMMTYMLFPIVLLRFLGVHVPYGLTLQEGDPFKHVFNRLRILPFRPLLSYGFRHAQVLQAISTYLAEWGNAMGFRGKPMIIPNGVDIQKFSKEYSRRELELLKQKLEKKVNTVFLITTSRLVKKNSIDSVIEALPHLPKHIHFLILGSGPEEDNLKKLAFEQGVMSRVCFLGDISQEDIPKYLKISDIFVRPSRSEGMGISFVEAMAAGVPVIATQEGGISDFLFDPEKNPDIKSTGLVVHMDDPKGIAKQTLRYESDISLRREITDNAKALVRARYDWKAIAPIMRERFFGLLLNESKRLST